jgi:hypothetical protein
VLAEHNDESTEEIADGQTLQYSEYADIGKVVDSHSETIAVIDAIDEMGKPAYEQAHDKE